MTIICYRDGIMAADSGSFCESMRMGAVTKIIRGPDGTLYGPAGDNGACERFRQWVAGNYSYPLDLKCGPDDFHAIAVQSSGDVFSLKHDGFMVPNNVPFDATGIAWKFAMGAMAYGASAEEAVRLCIKHDAYCAGPIQVEHLINLPN